MPGRSHHSQTMLRCFVSIGQILVIVDCAYYGKLGPGGLGKIAIVSDGSCC